MATRPILLYGFEPFLNFSENPSEKIARTLNASVVGGAKVVGKVLPVDYGKVEGIIVRDIRKHNPSVVLGTGLAPGRPVLSLEKIAVNYKFSAEPDNRGKKMKGAPIDSKAPDGIFSNMSPEKMASLLNSKGVPASVSLTAGAYLCNFAMFIIVRESLKGKFRGGFVHIPYDDSMASADPRKFSPYMNLDTMVRGIELLLGAQLKS